MEKIIKKTQIEELFGKDDSPVIVSKAPNHFKQRQFAKDRNPQRFFNLKEDSIILLYWQENHKKMKLSRILQKLAVDLNRNPKSVRDRLKKYLMFLSPKDKRIILKFAKVRIKVIC